MDPISSLWKTRGREFKNVHNFFLFTTTILRLRLFCDIITYYRKQGETDTNRVQNSSKQRLSTEELMSLISSSTTKIVCLQWYGWIVHSIPSLTVKKSGTFVLVGVLFLFLLFHHWWVWDRSCMLLLRLALIWCLFDLHKSTVII